VRAKFGMSQLDQQLDDQRDAAKEQGGQQGELVDRQAINLALRPKMDYQRQRDSRQREKSDKSLFAPDCWGRQVFALYGSPRGMLKTCRRGRNRISHRCCHALAKYLNRSVSVMIPTKAPSLTTGRAPNFLSTMREAAVCGVAFGSMVMTSRVMISRM